ncbi:hypothetical protein LCGC14_2184580, partial [marine sediment metagenome]
ILPELNPFLRDSFIDALIVGNAGQIFELYLQIQAALNEMFPDTATTTFLERWGDYVGITRNPATQATGGVTATGTAASSIPISTQLQTADGRTYETTVAATIAVEVLGVALTRTGTTVTGTTASEHMLANGVSVTIAGAVETEYNGAFSVIVTGLNEFQYEIVGTPTTPATGAITATFTIASLNVLSVGFGQAQNADAGEIMTFTTPIAGVDTNATVQFGDIGGGTDIETDEELRERILARYRDPVANFNAAQIRNQARLVPGVTRVFVDEAGTFLDPLTVTSITLLGNCATVTTPVDHNLNDCIVVKIAGANEPEYNLDARILLIDNDEFIYIVNGSPSSPATGTITATPSIPPGQVRIFFTRDNDDDIIPSASEVATVKASILEIKPAHTADFDVIVLAPTAVTVDFTFASLAPNTTTMQQAVTANLEAFFREETTLGQDLTEVSYQSIIFQTIDPATGQKITDFLLSAPIGDITVPSGSLPVLGTVSFP